MPRFAAPMRRIARALIHDKEVVEDDASDEDLYYFDDEGRGLLG